MLKLPLGMINKAAGEAIGEEIGEFLEVDPGDDNMANGCILRVKVKLDIRKPLMRGLTILTGEEGKERWCPLMYEYLPDFCYVCGIIGHTDRVCVTKLGKGEVAQFGKELRFKPPRRGFGGDIYGRGYKGRGNLPWRGGPSNSPGSDKSRSDAPSWKRSTELSNASQSSGKSWEKEVTSPMKIGAPSHEEGDTDARKKLFEEAKDGRPEGDKQSATNAGSQDHVMQVNSTMQIIPAIAVKGGKEVEGDGRKGNKKDGSKGETGRKFKRLPRSENPMNDNMCIDVKKRPLDNEGEDLVGKRSKGAAEGSEAVTTHNVDAGLSKQPCNDQ